MSGPAAEPKPPARVREGSGCRYARGVSLLGAPREFRPLLQGMAGERSRPWP